MNDTPDGYVNTTTLHQMTSGFAVLLLLPEHQLPCIYSPGTLKLEGAECPHRTPHHWPFVYTQMQPLPRPCVVSRSPSLLSAPYS